MPSCWWGQCNLEKKSEGQISCPISAITLWVNGDTNARLHPLLLRRRWVGDALAILYTTASNQLVVSQTSLMHRWLSISTFNPGVVTNPKNSFQPSLPKTCCWHMAVSEPKYYQLKLVWKNIVSVTAVWQLVLPCTGSLKRWRLVQCIHSTGNTESNFVFVDTCNVIYKTSVQNTDMFVNAGQSLAL